MSGIPQSGNDQILRHLAATIELLVRLYFERMHPHMPIISPAPFWQSFKLEEDLTDHRFYSLLIALCSAVSVSMHGEEMPAELLSAYGSWEEVGRAFNAAVPPKRTRDMFADKRADVVQNIMLIVVYVPRKLSSCLVMSKIFQIREACGQ